MDSIAAQKQNVIPPTIPSKFPVIAGFWRRLLAFIIDSTILGSCGLIIGAIFSKFLFNLGPYAQPIGLIFVLPYFGILNSRIGHGQTLGKKIVGIAVRGTDNEPISLWKSLLRILILVLPIYLESLTFYFQSSKILPIVLATISYCVGIAIFYTMIFNKRSRQGIHDLLLSTYVVSTKKKRIGGFPETPRIHWIITGVLVAIMAICVPIMSSTQKGKISDYPINSLAKTYDVLIADPDFFSVGYSNKTSMVIGSNEKHSTLVVKVWMKGKPTQEELFEKTWEIGKIVLDNFEAYYQYDALSIQITTGYDIGITNFKQNYQNTGPLDYWLNHYY